MPLVTQPPGFKKKRRIERRFIVWINSLPTSV
jgi:hypothetical protein